MYTHSHNYRLISRLKNNIFLSQRLRELFIFGYQYILQFNVTFIPLESMDFFHGNILIKRKFREMKLLSWHGNETM